MPSFRACIAVVIVSIVVPAGAWAEQDLRVAYSTDNLETVSAIQRGLAERTAGRRKEAIVHFEAALRHDPKCGAAWYHIGYANQRVLQTEAAIAAYKKVLADDIHASQGYRALAAFNIGAIISGLGKPDEANLWYTRAVLEDHDNRWRERARAYLSLAENMKSQQRHLGAAVAVALAYDDKARDCDMNLVRQYAKAVGKNEVARILYVDEPAVSVKPRGTTAALREAPITGALSGTIRELLPDAKGRYVVATVAEAGHYYLIRPGEPLTVQKVDAPASVAACLADGSLYVARTDPGRIDKLDVETGKIQRTFALDGRPAPRSLCVLPAHDRLYFPSFGIVCQLDLGNGAVRSTNTPGQIVSSHPSQRFVFSYTRPDRGGSTALVVVDGKLYVMDGSSDRKQPALFKSIVTPSGLLLAESRDNVAANGGQIVVSPEGNWVGVVGGEKPKEESTKDQDKDKDKVGNSPDGMALYESRNLESLFGQFKTGVEPIGACINPVTRTVVVVAPTTLNVYDVTAPAAGASIPGTWGPAAAWSGDGQTLLVAKAGGGLTAFRLNLTKDETAAAAKWSDSVTVTPLIGSRNPDPIAAREPSPQLKTFAVPADLTAEAVAKHVQQAISSGKAGRLVPWLVYPPYSRNPSAKDLSTAVATLRNATRVNFPVQLARIREAEKTPGFPPMYLARAEYTKRGSRKAEADKQLVLAVRADAGVTDLTLEALASLAELYEWKGEPLKTAYCWASALALDTARSDTQLKLSETLMTLKLDAEAAAVTKLPSAGDTGAQLRALTNLPPLPPPGNLPKLGGEDIYSQCVPSVVVIKTPEGTGSGVCIGADNIVITNAHVVERADTVDVHLFAMNDGKLTRRAVVKARVIDRLNDKDLAIVRLPKDAPKLKPLPVANALPRTGSKVYALGSPGLGSDVLEQSISEGIVSAAERKFNGKNYIQHSSAVNPGNSGGPLLDERGCVIGIVTLKARLQNVNFAIPASIVRGLFPEPKK